MVYSKKSSTRIADMGTHHRDTIRTAVSWQVGESIHNEYLFTSETDTIIDAKARISSVSWQGRRTKTCSTQAGGFGS